MFDFFIDTLHRWSELLPLPWFVFSGAFIEELIAPIPSPLVMTLGGSLAEAQGQHVIYLVFLAFVGAIGKSIGGYFIYLIANKFEHIVTGRFGKYIGISDKQMTALSKKLGKGWKDNVALFLLRAAPIMPTAPVSFAAGLLKLPLRDYLLSSAAGLFVRNLFYLYLGYTSAGALENINSNLESAETIGSVLVLVAVAGVFVYILKKRREQDKE